MDIVFSSSLLFHCYFTIVRVVPLNIRTTFCVLSYKNGSFYLLYFAEEEEKDEDEDDVDFKI